MLPLDVFGYLVFLPFMIIGVVIWDFLAPKQPRWQGPAEREDDRAKQHWRISVPDGTDAQWEGYKSNTHACKYLGCPARLHIFDYPNGCILSHEYD